MMIKRYSPKLIQLADEIGLKLDESDTRDIAWNGDSVALSLLKLLDSDLAHELGHFSVCAPTRRSELDWGLGWSHDTTLAFHDNLQEKILVSSQECEDEEMRASAVGICIQYALDLDWRFTYNFHSWDNVGDMKAFLEALEEAIVLPHLPGKIRDLMIQSRERLPR